MIAPVFRSSCFRVFTALPRFAGVLFPLLLPPPAVAEPDTLEVFVLYVEFKEEPETDNEPGTTGRGIFGSDKELAHKLDPNGRSTRLSAHYLTKRFQFAQDYFDRVSDGNVVILPRIFPRPDANNDSIVPVTLAHRLGDRMKAYNPAFEDKSAKQKTSDFAKQRAIALMRFVSEAADLYDTGDSTANPFFIALKEGAENPSTRRHRAFLLFHAGHSRLVDGGTLGYLGANTPNDFTDFFVTKPDFQYLNDSTLPAGLRKDSLGVSVRFRGADTVIPQFMMLSESANQDGINWGINGILINQLARQMGMPDLFDVVKGISQVGTFDVMDFAGYNTMQGFLPVFPSAWVRAFMGWDEPVVARAGDAGGGTWSEYRIHAADRPGGDRMRTLKVPLNEREYLLVENRQRAAGTDTVTVWFSEPAGTGDFTFGKRDSVKVPYAFLDSLFLDSLCTGTGSNRCAVKEPNPKRPRGIITRASHYDVGLPGNGLLVWHVNEWFLELLLPSGAVNAWLGDTLRSQYKGLELVEADGVPSIGKEFSDPLGQPAFDYGTARDMLPHIYRKRRNPPKDTSWAPAETLTVIGPYGFANTNAWNDGRTHIRLEARLPATPALAPGVSGFSGDSVSTVRDSAITLRVHWPDSLGNKTVTRPDSARWPVRTPAAGNPRAVSVLRDGPGGRAHIVSAGDGGFLQTYTAAGRPALAARDTVRDSGRYAGVEVLLSSGNRRAGDTVLVNSLADTAGATLGSAVARDSVLAVLTPRGLRLAVARADSLDAGWDTTLALRRSGGRDTLIAFPGKAGPMAWGGKVFALDSMGALRWWNPDGGQPDSAALPPGDWHALAGIVFHEPGGGADSQQVVIAGALGRAVRVNPATGDTAGLNPKWGAWAHDTAETFTATVADFDRDGHDDVFLLGSRGAGLLIHARDGRAGRAFAGWPQRLPRSAPGEDSLGTYLAEDRTPPALADLDRDGRPDVVFSGTNGVYAMDWRGAMLRGWPFRMQPRQPVGLGYANRNLPGSVIGSTPLALSLRGSPAILIASPDGLVYAVDSAGKAIGYSSLLSFPDQAKGSGVLMRNRSDWPLSVGGLTLDSTRAPFVHLTLARLGSGAGDLSLIAQTATGSLGVWTLPGTPAAPGGWSMPGGDFGRTQRLAAAGLDDTATTVERETIEEFRLYPSPLRGGVAKIHLKLGKQASGARIRVYDLSGRAVKDETYAIHAAGTQPVREIDLRHLGPDVYSVLCEVSFPGGKKSKWQRLGVIK